MRGSGIPRRHPGEIYNDLNLKLHKRILNKNNMTFEEKLIQIVNVCRIYINSQIYDFRNQITSFS